MDGAETPAGPAAARPRAPAPVAVAVALLWLLVAGLAWMTAVSAALTAFQVSTLAPDPLRLLAFLEPLVFLGSAAAVGLLAVKLWTGRDWARRVVLLLCAVVLVTALLTGVALNVGAGMAGAAVFALLLVLVVAAPTQRWCDRDAPRHSPRIGDRAEPPFLVVAELVLLWAVVVLALWFSAQALRASGLGMAPPWAAPALLAAALVHGALNLALTRRREWGRIGTAGLAVAYGLALLAAAGVLLAQGGSWLLPLVLSLVPAAFAWALLGGDSKSWCGG
ncbi:hypothetical protein [Glycomyces terrestris]|uniref:Uncharacterized protein n=1 Tax=Glycomyces terrestris TaxID=2493553 RepID=A0A426UXL9_9ACTN|nr:hypothetical protein [Glycomyces terrestris]RRR99265.1 hypothetical protein EIW28_11085 [Glycomyces terrestris]